MEVCRRTRLLFATHPAHVCNSWKRSRVLSNTLIAAECSIGISNREPFCSTIEASHWSAISVWRSCWTETTILHDHSLPSEPQVLSPPNRPVTQPQILPRFPTSTVSARFCSTCLPDVHHSWVPIRFPLFARRLKRRRPNSARWHHRSIATWRRFAHDASNVIQKRATSPLATSQPIWNAGSAAVWLFGGDLFRASQFKPPDRSIAVLPFTDSSEAKDQNYLCDGISEEILHTLAQVDGLRVAGRTSSFSLKGKNTKEVGEKLNVGNVLEGSLQRQGNRVRVTAELTDARNGFRVWTETYDRELDGAFALQDEIARSIVDALKIKFGVRVSAHEQPGSGVYDRYLQGLFTDVTRRTGVSGVGISVPVQNPSDPFTVPDYTSAM